MKVAGQQHYEAQYGASDHDYDLFLEDWARKVKATVAACGNDRKVYLTLMMEATND